MKGILWKVHKRILKLLARHVPAHQLRRLLLSAAGYHIGHPVFIGEELIIKDELHDRGMVTIGDRVAIADRVTLVVSSNANFSEIRPLIGDVHAPIELADDAWLGTGAIILPGIRVGKGAVVGAGSIVTADVPDFTVVAGNPARALRKVTEIGPAYGAGKRRR
jgi:maltose O-acetyltransferase